MNDNLSVWLETLKSGEYQQTTGRLSTINEDGTQTFCCLGVACDLALKAGLDLNVETSEDDDSVLYNEEGGILPKLVRQWLGVNDMNPMISIENSHFDPTLKFESAYSELHDLYQQVSPRYLVHDRVTQLNDDYGLTFEQIAQLVEYAGFSEEV